MIIKNGLVWEESGSFRKKELVVDTTTHRIAETAEDDTVFDAEGLYVIPGLVDVHIHGARGHDFSDGNSKGLAEIAQYLHSCGVTSFCPTSMTLPEEQLTAAFATINDVPDAAGYAHIAGIHMEGPYLSPEKKGAQKASYLHAPDAAMVPTALCCKRKQDPHHHDRPGTAGFRCVYPGVQRHRCDLTRTLHSIV